MPLLEISNLHVAYGPIRVVHGIDLVVDEGKIVALIGANGAGKTTVLRTVSGLLRPQQGMIQFHGAPIVRMAAHEIVRRGLVQVPEGRGIFANLTVRENLDLAASVCRGRSSQDRDEVLELFPRLRERLDQNAGTLSGGEQQMLAIARALLARPRLLLLDEPSLGLAPQLVQTIFRLIREINHRGTTVLLVEQNAHMAIAVSHNTYVLETGRIARSGPSAELAASDEIRKAYLGG